MPQLNLPKVNLNFDVWGKPEQGTITLLNGHTRSLTDFRMLGRRLVESGYEVIVLDNRGAGETVSASSFSLDDMAGDVVALWHHLGITSTNVLGISMGGFIAMRLAERYPETISRLFLVSTAAYTGGIVSDGRSWNGSESEIAAKLARYFSPAYAEKNQVVLATMARQIAKGVSEGQFLAGSQAQREAIHGFDARASLPQLAIPTVLIHGTEDVITPYTRAEEMHQLIPGSTLTPLAGAGHLLLAERPQEFFRILVESLSEA